MTSGDGRVNPRAIRKLAHLFNEEGYTLFAVGGSVRNGILGYPATDQDVASAMPPGDVMTLCRRHRLCCIPKGVKYGTVEIIIGGTHLEHTTFRGEVYGTEGGHKPEFVEFTTDLIEDAFRRDLTVNALYRDILSGELIDPTGGLADMRNGLLRATCRPPELIMRDDAVRILRLARLASELGFNIDGATYMAAKKYIGGLVYITPERIQHEITKILLADVKYGVGSVMTGLGLLESFGALDILMPELTLGRGIEQNPDYHAHDVLTHCLMTAACAKPDLELRLAALLHDVGKPIVYQETGRFFGHDERGAQIAFNILKRLRYKNSVCNNVAELVFHHMFDLDGRTKESKLRIFTARRGFDMAMRLADLREADVHGSGIITGEVKTAVRHRAIVEKMVEEGVPTCERQLACTGRDVRRWANVHGDDISKVKHVLIDYVATHPKRNNKQDLKKYCEKLYTPMDPAEADRLEALEDIAALQAKSREPAANTALPNVGDGLDRPAPADARVPADAPPRTQPRKRKPPRADNIAHGALPNVGDGLDRPAPASLPDIPPPPTDPPPARKSRRRRHGASQKDVPRET